MLLLRSGDMCGRCVCVVHIEVQLRLPLVGLWGGEEDGSAGFVLVLSSSPLLWAAYQLPMVQCCRWVVHAPRPTLLLLFFLPPSDSFLR